MTNTPETVIIAGDEYRRLCAAKKKLGALEAGGVDNWEGYWESIKHLYAEEEDED